MDHHVDDDGCAEHRRDGADAHLRGGEGGTGDEVAEQAEHAAAQKARRDHTERLRRLKEGFHQVRHGDAHKGDGAGKGRDAGGQHAGQQDQRRPERPQRHAHVLGVDLPQLIRPDGLGQQEGQQQRDAADSGHGLYILPAHAGEGAQRPVVQVHDAGIIGKGHEKIRQRRADIADHHAADHQQAHALDPLGDQQHEAHGYHGAHEGRRDENGGGGGLAPAQQRQHGHAHRHLRAGGDTQHEGAGDGVMEKGLQQIAGQGQRPAQDQRRQKPGQTDLHDDLALRKAHIAAQQDPPYLRRGKRNASREDVPNQKCE